LPLPPNPSVELLNHLHLALTSYLGWVTDELSVRGATADELRQAIERATPRFVEIGLHWPEAQAEKEEPDPSIEPPGEVTRDEGTITKLLSLAEGLVIRIEDTLEGLPFDAINEKRFVALMLARECLEMFEDEQGRRHSLDEESQAALAALFDEFEDAERGFGPRDASTAER